VIRRRRAGRRTGLPGRRRRAGFRTRTARRRARSSLGSDCCWAIVSELSRVITSIRVTRLHFNAQGSGTWRSLPRSDLRGARPRDARRRRLEGVRASELRRTWPL
jgi:hypothetical protein